MRRAILMTAWALTLLTGVALAQSRGDSGWKALRQSAEAQYKSERYQDSIETFTKAIAAAQADKQTPSTEIKAALGAMYVNMGNANLKLKRTDDAIAAYSKAAAFDPHPGVAYFNLCATQYNSGNVDGALAACEKSIAADPQRADAYFIKGSLLVSKATTTNGSVVAPPGTLDALNRYLVLAPNGPHAADVRAMLDYLKP